MGFASPVICKIRHIKTKKERTIHVSELKHQQTENTSERLQQADTTLKVQGYIQGFPKDSTGKKSPRIPPRIPKGYYEKRQRIPPRIPKGYYEKSLRSQTGLQAEPTPKILQGNYKGSMKYIKNIRRTSRTQREQTRAS